MEQIKDENKIPYYTDDERMKRMFRRLATKPLSCHREMHFAKKVGKEWEGMYCKVKIPTILDKLRPLQAKYWQLMYKINMQIQKSK